jgi:glycosyltransferase involved in cell wall biosynthesis
MASGLPVVLTPFDGQSTAIGRPGIEFAQSARSVESLTRTLGELLANEPRRLELARRGRRWVREHVALDRTLDRFADFYDRAAAPPAPRDRR